MSERFKHIEELNQILLLQSRTQQFLYDLTVQIRDKKVTNSEQLVQFFLEFVKKHPDTDIDRVLRNALAVASVRINNLMYYLEKDWPVLETVYKLLAESVSATINLHLTLEE